MNAYGQPDPAQQPVTRLGGGAPVTLMEQRGQWANVRAANGWTGWVDAGRLSAIVPPQIPPPPPPPPPAADAPSPPPLYAPAYAPAGPAGSSNTGVILAAIGSGLVLLSTALPWFDLGSDTENAFFPGAEFLWDYESTAQGGLSVGLLLVGFGGASLALSFARDLAVARRIAALLALAVAIVFAVQVNQGLEAAKDQAGAFGVPDLSDVLGIGVVVAIVGAALATFAPRARRT